jgi:broad specificity phosphatase PhoE
MTMEGFPARRRIYLLRHGEVNYIEQGRAAPPDSVHLNEEGRAQAQAAADALADVPFDRAVVSGLSRTVETARIVLGERTMLLEELPTLREIRGGKFLHLPPAELRSTFVEALTRRLTATDTFLLGETFGDFRDRVRPAFQALLGEPGWSHMLLVLHGGVNRMILADIMDLDLHGLGHLEQDAGCINLIDFDERGYGIVRIVNYTPYNPLKVGLSLTTMERYFLEFPPAEEDIGDRTR